MCEHHLLPFMGHTLPSYATRWSSVGSGGLARGESVSHAAAGSGRMTEQIADLLERGLGAKGVAVVLEASHMYDDSWCTETCKSLRHFNNKNFQDNVSSRAEVLSSMERIKSGGICCATIVVGRSCV